MGKRALTALVLALALLAGCAPAADPPAPLPAAENPDYLKPTIGPDGRVCWWYAALSHDGRDLPSTLDGRTLVWRRAGIPRQNDRDPAFSEEQWEGVPILSSRRMRDGGILPADREALARFSSCGKEYAGSPLLVFDLWGNGGGSDKYIMDWFQGWTGAEARPRMAFSHRYSQISCLAFDGSYPAERVGAYSHYSNPGAWVERSGPVFVLQDKAVASSGETAVRFFHTAADTLMVGGPTMGCSLTPNNVPLYLPHSSLGCYFGTGLSLSETGENVDGAGFLPDLWVEPVTALDAVKRLIEYYGLNRKEPPSFRWGALPPTAARTLSCCHASPARDGSGAQVLSRCAPSATAAKTLRLRAPFVGP